MTAADQHHHTPTTDERAEILAEVAQEDDRQYAGGSMHGLGALGGAEMALDALAARLAAANAKCECFVTPESEWLSAASCGYGSGYEPGSQMEYNPDCPVHGERAVLDQPTNTGDPT